MMGSANARGPSGVAAHHEAREHPEAVVSEALARSVVTVVGVGAIGRQVALQLATVGVAALELVDLRIVERADVGTGGYPEADLGLPRAEATARWAAELNAKVRIDPRLERFHCGERVGESPLYCTDEIERCQVIHEAAGQCAGFFAHASIVGEQVRIFTASNARADQYDLPLDPRESASDSGQPREDAAAVPCFSFAANIAAGLMLEQFARHLRGRPVLRHLTLELATHALTVEPDPSVPGPA